jgi:hypothetical protein
MMHTRWVASPGEQHFQRNQPVGEECGTSRNVGCGRCSEGLSAHRSAWPLSAQLESVGDGQVQPALCLLHAAGGIHLATARGIADI